MLIVNADDLGASRSTTDPVIEGFAIGAITSTSAMVWMPDTIRAAQLAVDRGLPVGLHLNLTLPFGADEVPAAARERQLALTAAFGSESWRGEDQPAVDGPAIAAAITEQLDEFRARFGEPTHVDGHHHVHVHPLVLAQLPRTYPIRPPLSFFPGRGLHQRRLLRRFRTPETCLAFEHLHPDLGGEGLERLAPAGRRCLEVMTHPAQAAQMAALRGDRWRQALATLPLGSYRNL